ncbi:MAG: TonB-dependent receptor [Bacteroidales bacterium]|nr:TonB-dependent receptor [Bacteroidales bacterium]MCF8390999.1 TonB-dependent receptor [Bacteroidales bacterium]
MKLMFNKVLKIVKAMVFLGLLFFFSNAYAQPRVISGKIIDAADASALPGVNVVIKGTTTGVISNLLGEYTIQVSGDDAILIFSYIGYEKLEQSVAGISILDVNLKQETTALDELVVIGYGTVRKSDLTGSVSSVKGDDLIKIPSSNPLMALQGKVSGVQVSSSSGEPGGAAIVRVRGVGTLNNTNPIFVVDGVILDDVSFLNTNDIASIEALKDASATAIYGSRGANGVFIITTKMGGFGKEAQVNFKSELSVQKLQKEIDVLSGREFAEVLNEITPGTINNLDAVADYDWQESIFQENPLIKSYDLSFMGGSDKMGYYLGAGVYDQDGIIPKSTYKRYNFKLNTDYQIKKNIKVGSNMSASYIDDDNAPNVVISAYRAWPIDEPYDANNNFAEVRGTGNPLAAIEYSNSNSKNLRLINNTYIELTLLKDIKLKSSYQLDYSAQREKIFSPEYYVSPTQQVTRNSLSLDFTEDRRWIWENTASYYKEIGEHRINAVAGITAQELYYESPGMTVNRLINEDPTFWYVNAALSDTVYVGDSPYETSMSSFLGRVNYSFNGKYLFTASFRADGSSKFESNNQWGYFPTFATGWNISDEDFFPEVDAIDNLKIRASWGIIGNEKISWNDRYSLIGNDFGAVFGSPELIQSGATFSGTGNDLLTWESTYQTNLGFELNAFSNKFTAEVDFYRKETKDILVYLSVPGYYGFGSYAKVRFNAANVLNRGMELNLGWREKKGDFFYSFNVLATTVHNEVLELGATSPSDSIIYAGSLSNGQRVTATTVGNSIGYFLGYRIQGVFQNQDDLDTYPSIYGQKIGDLIYEDVVKDGVINEKDKVEIGSPIPDLIYGFSATLGYKKFSVSMDFQGQYGNEIYNGKNQTRFSLYNFEGKVRDRWNGEGSSNTEPKITSLGGNYQTSDYFIENGSYLRLRTLLISYDLPEKLMEKAGLGKSIIYLRGTNIFTLSSYSGYSPDIGGFDPLSTGIDQGIYPITSAYSLGINVTF